MKKLNVLKMILKKLVNLKKVNKINNNKDFWVQVII